MVRQMNLKKGDIVLDLGCGFGSASIFLAKTYGVTVIAVDLWFSPSALTERMHTVWNTEMKLFYSSFEEG